MLPAMPLASNRLCRGMPNGVAHMFASCNPANLSAVLGGQPGQEHKLYQAALCIELGLVLREFFLLPCLTFFHYWLYEVFVG